MWPQWSVIEINPDVSKTKVPPLGRWPGSLPSDKAGNVFEITVFEVDTSLKWMPLQSKL